MLSIVTLLLIAPIAAASSASAETYTFTQIDVPGATITDVTGINDMGQIVGVFTNRPPGGGGIRGFIYSGGNFSTVDAPGATFTVARDINNAGQIVGTFGDSTGNHGFLDNGGSFITLDVPGTTGATDANGINDVGQIVGDFISGGGLHGFLYSGGSFTPLEVPYACCGTTANDINNVGQIVGRFEDVPPGPPGSFGFLYSGDIFTTLGLPGTETAANGINDVGQIVGTFSDSTGSHGFLYTGGSFTQIDVPFADAFDTNADGINDAGQIVGSFSDSTGQHGFLATPVLPTPVFAGNPLAANCHGQSVSALARQYGGLSAAAEALGYSSVKELQNAIKAYCEPNYQTVGSVALISNTQFEAVSPLWPSDYAGEIAAVNIPEPSTLALLGVGIGLTILCVRRRRAIASKPL